ncbi:MAG: hypothetical protein D6736_09135, partial [Nitrospinota bacterium]
MLLLLILGGWTLLVSAQVVEVTGQRVNVRAGPGLSSAVITVVERGDRFPVLGKRGAWYHIQLPDGRRGWIYEALVREQAGTRGMAVVGKPAGQGRFSLPYTTSWAVVIGIDRYAHPQIPELHYAVNDARSVARLLTRLGFPPSQIFLLVNEEATLRRIAQVLYHKLRAAGPNDRLFVFFAGHGQTVPLPKGGAEGFLLPYDADPTDPFTTALSMTEVKRIGQRIAARHILFAVDACYSGFTVTRAVAPPLVDARYLALVARDPAVQVITAGQAGEQVEEAYGHGVFTQQLLKGLEGFADSDRNGVITGLELAAFL